MYRQIDAIENPEIDLIYISNGWDKGKISNQWEKDKHLVNGLRQLTNHCGGGESELDCYLFPIHQNKSRGSSIYVRTRIIKVLEKKYWDFPGGPVAKTPHSQSRGPGFHPWSGN